MTSLSGIDETMADDAGLLGNEHYQALVAHVTSITEQMTKMEIMHAETRTALEESERAAAAAGNAGGGAKRAIDTRGLGKPDMFTGSAAKWRDWRVIARAFLCCLHGRLEALMRVAEKDLTSSVVNATLAPPDVAASEQLYFSLLMLCRDAPLTKVVNAGEGQGLAAWRSLHESYEPSSKEHWVGWLTAILGFSLDGDLEERLEAFDRACRSFQESSGEALTDQMRIGIILYQLLENAMKTHLQMNIAKLTTYVDFRKEIVDIRRAVQVSAPMDVGAIGKGGAKGAKGDKKCNYCGKPGHFVKDCRKKKADDATGGKKSDGGKGNKGERSKSKCYNCNGTGHFARDCKKPKKPKGRSKGANSLEEGEEEGDNQEDEEELASLFLCVVCGRGTI